MYSSNHWALFPHPIPFHKVCSTVPILNANLMAKYFDTFHPLLLSVSSFNILFSPLNHLLTGSFFFQGLSSLQLSTEYIVWQQFLLKTFPIHLALLEQTVIIIDRFLSFHLKISLFNTLSIQFNFSILLQCQFLKLSRYFSSFVLRTCFWTLLSRTTVNEQWQDLQQ